MNTDLNGEKSVAQSSFDETKIEDGVLVLTYKNETSEVQWIEKEIDSDFIQFHFCVKGDTN